MGVRDDSAVFLVDADAASRRRQRDLLGGYRRTLELKLPPQVVDAYALASA